MVTALLEGDTLLLRGEIHASFPRGAIAEVTIVGDELRFAAAGEPVTLALGTTAARRWATALSTPPPTLAGKLDIDASSRVRLFGASDDDALDGALLAAAALLATDAPPGEAATLVVVRADGQRELETALATHLASPERDVPFWVVYRKGKNVPLNEAGVRAAVRARGLIDTKVAGVSATLSALRFMPRAIPEAALAPTSPRASRAPRR